jgi:tRNA(fMet)-specific endonuclease VapC
LRDGHVRSDRRAEAERLLAEFLAPGIVVLLIAALARRRGATLVTANGREFARVPGLMVTDWAA